MARIVERQNEDQQGCNFVPPCVLPEANLRLPAADRGDVRCRVSFVRSRLIDSASQFSFTNLVHSWYKTAPLSLEEGEGGPSYFLRESKSTELPGGGWALVARIARLRNFPLGGGVSLSRSRARCATSDNYRAPALREDRSNKTFRIVAGVLYRDTRRIPP